MAIMIDEYKKLIFRKGVPDESMLVPLLVWSSGHINNIELAQKINSRFFYIPKDLNMRTLYYNNVVSHFIKYPKVPKDEPKLKFFYSDLATYYGWSLRELKKNLIVLDLNLIKPEIAKAFGYDNKQRKVIGLAKLEGLTNGSKKKKQKKSTRHIGEIITERTRNMKINVGEKNCF